MAKKYRVIGNNFNESLVGLQFAAENGTPLFTIGNFQLETTLTEKVNKNYNIGEASDYYTLTDLGETTQEDNTLRKNKTRLNLNPDYTNPKSYSYFGSIKEYFRVNIEGIIQQWPASIYVDKVFNNTTGNTVENYSYNPITKKSNFKVNNNFFNNSFDIKYTNQYITSNDLDNKLRNLNVEYGRYTIFYDGIEYPLINFTGSTLFSNDYVYFEVDGNPFPLITGSTLSTNYHIKPNSIEVETFYSSLSDLSNELLNRYVLPANTIKFTYISESTGGPFDIVVNREYTWPVVDGYNIDITTTLFDTYLTSIYEFCDYFDENDTNIMNRMLVADSINKLNTIRRGDGSEDENDAEKVTKLINIYAREFDEVKKYIDGVSTIRNVTYDKNGNTPDSLVKDVAKTFGWDLLTPMSDINLISSFIPTKSVYSGYTINYSKYDAEVEFWRRLIMNTTHLWKSKGSRKAIEFLFQYIGSPEQLVNFNEYVYVAKKPINVELFKVILKQLTGADDISIYNLDEEGFPKILPETPYNYYQSNGLWYRETSGSNAAIDILNGNNPHTGPYDAGKNYLEQFRCLIGSFSAYTQGNGSTIRITNEYIEFSNLFKNYSDGLINDYSGEVFLNDYNVDGKPNLCFSVSGTVITDPDPQNVLGICGCPIDVSDHALMLGFKKEGNISPCNTGRTTTISSFTGRTFTGDYIPLTKCDVNYQSIINKPPIILFSSTTTASISLVPIQCCTSTILPNVGLGAVVPPKWVNVSNGLGYCFWDKTCGDLTILDLDINKNIIFVTGAGKTGTTSSELSTNIGECCSYFGGVFNPTTGTCNLQLVNSEILLTGSTGTTCQLSIVTDINDDIILNTDGTVSFIDGLGAIVPGNLECCRYNSTNTLPLSFCGGNCYWTDPSKNCDFYNDIKVTLGVDGSDGVYILSGSNENCFFQVEFDMLINFDCTKLLTCIGNNSILESLSAFTIDATIETATGTTPTTLQVFPAYKFNIDNKPTGIYFTGQESNCNSLNNQILIELSGNCDTVTSETFSPKWTTVKFNINNSIVGQKIKLGFNFNNIPCEFNFLVDNIKIDKLCIVTNEDILNLTNCPGFDITRIVDNKKSWDYTETMVKRTVDYLDFRETSYYEYDSRLLLNSKEVDLTLDAAQAIDNDVLCYIRKNDCFFTGNTGTTISDPYLSVFKTEIDVIDDVNEFREFVLTRLIDPKSRQVIRSYPLLRYLFDKYLNLCGMNTCDNLGNQYNYDSLQNFIDLIGDYWINLVEQLVPSTSIWKGATRFYRNTVFDQPKYKYKNYSLLYCNTDCETLSNPSYDCQLTIPESSFDGFIKNIYALSNPKTYESLIYNCWGNTYGYSTPIGEVAVAVPAIKGRYGYNDITDEPILLTPDQYGVIDASYASGEGITTTPSKLKGDSASVGLYYTLPDPILSCLSTTGKTLDLGTISVTGVIDDGLSGITIFDELVLSGQTINDLTNVDFTDIYNSMVNGFTNTGYSVLYSGTTLIVTSNDDNDCGKDISINVCVDIDLSCTSGGTEPSCVPYTYSDTIIFDPKTPPKFGAYSPINNCTYTISDSAIIIVSGGTNSLIINTTFINNILADIVYCPTNDSVYVLGVSPTFNMYVIDCSTNTLTTTISLSPNTPTINRNSSRMVYNSTDDLIFVGQYNGVLTIDCVTNTISNVINKTTIPYGGRQMTYDSLNNIVYISNGTGGVDKVVGTNYIENAILVPSNNFGIGYNPVNNNLYSTSTILGTPITIINSNSNLILNTIYPTGSTVYSEVLYNPLNDDMVFVIPKTINYSILSTSNVLDTKTLVNNNNPLGANLNSFVYNSVDEVLYGVLGDRNGPSLEIICLGGVSSTGGTIDTITTSCKKCIPLLNLTFEEISVSGTSVFDCNKCTGYENDNIEIIIEPIDIPYGTGITATTCIEVNNSQVCSNVHIKSINDDVTFSGKFNIGYTATNTNIT